MLRGFVEKEVEPQANDYNKREEFNMELFQKLGDSGLGILGLTAPEEYGGVGMDAPAVCLVHEELAYSDPAFCLSYLAHS
jgi:isovaleryl-CoA dehydrogenase